MRDSEPTARRRPPRPDARPPRRGRNSPQDDERRREAARARAEQLVAGGMPASLAHAVANGLLDLSEALERMARRQRVDRLMAEHNLSRALATQIALGHANLDDLLTRRRLDDVRATAWDRTVLEPGPTPMVLLTHGDRRITARILHNDRYQVRVQPLDERGQPAGPEEDIHKLQLKAAYPSAAWKDVRKVFKRDKAVQSSPRGPFARPQDRYACSDRRLFRLAEARADITVTTLEGDVFKGVVEWVSRFEFGLGVKGGAVVTVFRHALHGVDGPG